MSLFMNAYSKNNAAKLKQKHELIELWNKY